jgi:hypothetical protein
MPTSARTGQKSTDSPARKGDLAEHFVSLVAAAKGGEVFSNFGSTGAVDLVLQFGGKLYPIDVKLARRRTPPRSGWKADSYRVKPPVWPVVVYPTGKSFRTWKVSWGSRSPEGLDNLWNVENEADAAG